MKSYAQIPLTILILGLVSLPSCDPEPLPVTGVGNEIRSATVNVEVRQLYNTDFYVKDSAVSNAHVQLFKSMYDLNNNQNSDASRYTDSTGKLLISGRTGKFYYVLVDHPRLGKEIDSVSTPAGTISFVYIEYR